MKERRYVRVLTRREECKLSFNAWLVYSYLYCWKKPTSGKKIASVLRLDPGTVVRVRQELEQAGLLAKKKKLEAVDPPAKMFVLREGGLAYWILYLPDQCCAFSNIDNAVYWLLTSLKKVPSIKAIATLLGVSRPTAKKSVEGLKVMQLVKDGKVSGTPPEDWYKKKKPKVGRYEILDVDGKIDYIMSRFGEIHNKTLDTFRTTPVKSDPSAYIDPETGPFDPPDDKAEAYRNIRRFVLGAVSRKWTPGTTLNLLDVMVRQAVRFRGWKPLVDMAWTAGDLMVKSWDKMREHGYKGQELFHASAGWFKKDFFAYLSRIKRIKDNLSDWY